MNPLIKDGDIILDGTKTRKQAEKEAFEKLGEIETMLKGYGINSLAKLDAVLHLYTEIKTLMTGIEMVETIWK